jgi:hypothetical protein
MVAPANIDWRRAALNARATVFGTVIAFRELMLAMLLALGVGIQLLETSVTSAQTRRRFVCWNSPPLSLRI